MPGCRSKHLSLPTETRLTRRQVDPVRWNLAPWTAWPPKHRGRRTLPQLIELTAFQRFPTAHRRTLIGPLSPRLQ